MSLLRRDVSTFSSTHEGVLGTQLVFRARADRARDLRRAEAEALAEFDRLESIFSVYRSTSALCRWRSGSVDTPETGELRQLLCLGADWFTQTGGVFNPLVGRLSARWHQAGIEGRAPSMDEMATIAASISELPYAVSSDGSVQRTGDCRDLNFNALAKGLLIDLAATTVVASGRLRSLVISVGGDLVHVGEGSAAVRIEDPANAYDNAAPLDQVHVSGCGVATSGSTRRGLRIDGEWFSHVIDPRTGWPVDAVQSASVIARDAATADALATLVSVLPPAKGAERLGALDPSASCLIVGADGGLTADRAWASHRPR